MNEGPDPGLEPLLPPLLGDFVVAISSFVVGTVVSGGGDLLVVGVASVVVRVITSVEVVIGGQAVVVSVVGGASVVVGVLRGRSQALRQFSSESKMFGPLIGQKETLDTQDRESML